MSKLLFVFMILVDLVLGFAFVFSNLLVWSVANQPSYFSTEWGPLTVEFVPRPSVNGEPVPQVAFSVINYPFLVFWIALVTNIGFIVRLQ